MVHANSICLPSALLLSSVWASDSCQWTSREEFSLLFAFTCSGFHCNFITCGDSCHIQNSWLTIFFLRLYLTFFLESSCQSCPTIPWKLLFSPLLCHSSHLIFWLDFFSVDLSSHRRYFLSFFWSVSSVSWLIGPPVAVTVGKPNTSLEMYQNPLLVAVLKSFSISLASRRSFLTPYTEC